jgi:phage-related protein
MKTLSGVITDAANGSDSAAEKLSAVGLSIEDLNGKSQDEQLSIVISALQSMEAGAERTSAATDLLGKSATDMAAVLNTSAEETERLKQEAEDYGMVMSNDAVAASAAFEDSLTKLTNTAGGLKNRMVGELLPGITQIMDGFSDLIVGNENASEELKNGVTSVIGAIKELIPQAGAAPRAAKLVSSIAGAVLESAPGIIKALADGLLSAISELTPTVSKLVTELISALVELLPQIVSAGAEILLSLIKGIADTVPQLIPQIVFVITQIVQTLIDNLPMILDAALQLVTGLAEGILDALPVLIEALPQIINGIVDFLIGAIPQIIEAGIQLLTSLVTALPEIISAIVEVIPEIIDGIIKAVISAISQIIQAGIKLLISLVENQRFPRSG